MATGVCDASHGSTGTRVQLQSSVTSLGVDLDIGETTLVGGFEDMNLGDKDVVRDANRHSSSSDGGVHLRDPQELITGLIGCGLMPESAAQVAISYYNANQVSITPTASVIEKVSVSSASTKAAERTERWVREMSSMPDVPGQCYLHVVRWGRRNAFSRALRKSPSFRDFVAMLEPGDMDMEIAKGYGLYRVSQAAFGTGVVYHIAKECDDGVYIGTVWDCVVGLIQTYPGVNDSFPCQSDNPREMPLVGVVGVSDLNTLPVVEKLCGTEPSTVVSASLELADVIAASDTSLQMPIYIYPAIRSSVYTVDVFGMDYVATSVSESSLLYFPPDGGRVFIDGLEMILDNHQVGMAALVPEGTRVIRLKLHAGRVPNVYSCALTNQQFLSLRDRLLFGALCDYVVVRPYEFKESLDYDACMGEQELPGLQSLGLRMKRRSTVVSDHSCNVGGALCIPANCRVGFINTQWNVNYSFWSNARDCANVSIIDSLTMTADYLASGFEPDSRVMRSDEIGSVALLLDTGNFSGGHYLVEQTIDNVNFCDFSHLVYIFPTNFADTLSCDFNYDVQVVVEDYCIVYCQHDAGEVWVDDVQLSLTSKSVRYSTVLLQPGARVAYNRDGLRNFPMIYRKVLTADQYGEVVSRCVGTRSCDYLTIWVPRLDVAQNCGLLVGDSIMIEDHELFTWRIQVQRRFTKIVSQDAALNVSYVALVPKIREFVIAAAWISARFARVQRTVVQGLRVNHADDCRLLS